MLLVEPKITVRVNTKIENQGKVSYIDLPLSSAACYYRRVDDGFAALDGVCKVEGQ